jgi:uncharacterized protein
MPELKKPIIGKTYSLYGGLNSSDSFYIDINYCVDLLLKKHSSFEELLAVIRKLSSKKKQTGIKDEKQKLILNTSESILSKYITGIDEHLKSLSLIKRYGSTIGTSRMQYLLYMLEFEISNRVNRERFMNTERKIALLPHCLHDLSKKCISEVDGLDYQCKGCSKACYINKMSKIFNNAGVIPYIWKEASKNKLFGKKGNSNTGVIGIACLPELINGIRSVSKRGLPVLGLPLDANRCVRWMGDFHENSVNLKQLELMIG